MQSEMARGARIWTVGHGTATAEGFAELVCGAGVESIVDVRRFPGSRRNPHFARDEMAVWLADHDVSYQWLPALGGRRRSHGVSPNIALRNPQFRAYADHMATGEFAAGGTDAAGGGCPSRRGGDVLGVAVVAMSPSPARGSPRPRRDRPSRTPASRRAPYRASRDPGRPSCRRACGL
jgi:hypothetical protein